MPKPSQDWPNLNKYQQANQRLKTPENDRPRVVFMGDSITEFWATLSPEFFDNSAYVDRGISGQTTPQILLRFHQDVVDLKPSVVVILAGTNDLAGNTGPSSNKMIEDNLAAMAEIASVHGIKVILSSILPAYDYDWRPGIYPTQRIIQLNQWMQGYCKQNGHRYVDYYQAMADEQGALPLQYSKDGVHPNPAGYQLMEHIITPVIQSLLTDVVLCKGNVSI